MMKRVEGVDRRVGEMKEGQRYEVVLVVCVGRVNDEVYKGEFVGGGECV